MEIIVAWLLALAALFDQWPSEIGNALQNGVVVQTVDFLGLEWPCTPVQPPDPELCYAGLSLTGYAPGLMTGP